MGQSGSAAAGAVVGQAAAVSVEKQRCSDIVDAVARQEPRLRWAAGTRADGSTALVTDLAGGWIPPGIAIPGDVELLDPGSFTPGQTLRDLVGDTEFDCQFAPGEQLGDDTTMGLSDSPRRVEPLPTLACDLRKAAEWRNHLPMVALTLAKSPLWASPMEIDELQRRWTLSVPWCWAATTLALPTGMLPLIGCCWRRSTLFTPEIRGWRVITSGGLMPQLSSGDDY